MRILSVGIVRARDDSCNNAVRSRRVNFQQSVGHPRIVTICSSVNRVFFMAPPGLEDAILSSVSWSENRQAGQVVMINVPEQEQCQTTI